MLVFSDVLTGDELFSDAFDTIQNGAAIEIDCKMEVVSEGDVDIGANPSAEDVEEAIENGAETVNNVVYAGRLQSTNFDKKSYMTYIKGYMKDLTKYLEEHEPERVEGFKKEATELVKKILGNFKDYEFYTGESMNPEGMVALLNYREDGTTPYMIFFKDGLKSQKY
ncbi:Ribosome associating protein [Coemansia sp. RSA 1813]|nr:Ribosome associating protein [Coemansia sp. RSA 1646]KAJ1771522.1 Ribosome associating protein [Coemansia sp. RSA 1843]KAJ2089619.1 Ribosome associating protein [Coemansia sp. RSA 986]KAJ2214721.1 Ribosome associating protein [Coemansia sp. RSA 487]KAJ2571529.1 Ribosome associating protein [Coemansia sp. RSA 1813]